MLLISLSSERAHLFIACFISWNIRRISQLKEPAVVTGSLAKRWFSSRVSFSPSNFPIIPRPLDAPRSIANIFNSAIFLPFLRRANFLSVPVRRRADSRYSYKKASNLRIRNLSTHRQRFLRAQRVPPRQRHYG